MTFKFKAGQLAKTTSNRNLGCYNSCKVGCHGHNYYGLKVRKIDNKIYYYTHVISNDIVVLVLNVVPDNSPEWLDYIDYMKNPVEILVEEEKIFVNADFLEELETK